MVNLAVLGLGARGRAIYGSYLLNHGKEARLTAVCDVDWEKVDRAKIDFGLEEKNCFTDAEAFFHADKLADAVLICTQDRDHYCHTLSALNAGYDVLLEKPISPKLSEIEDIERLAKAKNKVVLVAHVLRYTAFYRTIKSVIDSGEIGEIALLNQTENIAYWHFAHSFVRGPWRNQAESSPIILAKCCHDLDIFTFLLNAKCRKIQSFGELKYFNASHAPEGSSLRCAECKLRESCVYSAYTVYIRERIAGNNGWLSSYLCAEQTEEAILNAVRTGPYGRCVFHCDNDVCDSQTVNMSFERGITANLTLTAFTAECFRSIHVAGTKGEILADDKSNLIKMRIFGGEERTVDIAKISEDLSGHGGGDNRMMRDFIAYLGDRTQPLSTTISDSLRSHKMAFLAQESLEKNCVVEF